MTRTGAYPGSFNPLTVAHLSIAEAAREELDLDRVDLVVSRVALAKEHVEHPALHHRLGVLHQAARRLPWLGVVLSEAQLVVDLAAGYDAVILGADKWAQVQDPAFYGGSRRRRDEALDRLPLVALARRGPHPLPTMPGRVHVLEVPGAAGISSTGARAGRTHWMAPEAAEFDRLTGAWSDPPRYRRWLAGHGQGGDEEPPIRPRRGDA